MKKLFTSIRQGDSAAVTGLLDKKPELVASTATSPPKKDVGQSPLQVAIRTTNFAIAHLLLDRGADINFMEAEDCGAAFRMPVIQDAIRAAIISNCYDNPNTPDDAFALLKRMVDMGADLTKRDSAGSTALDRAVSDARQGLPSFNRTLGQYADHPPFTPEKAARLNRVFALIMSAAPEATQHFVTPDSKETLLVQLLADNGGLRYEPHRYDDALRRWIAVS